MVKEGKKQLVKELITMVDGKSMVFVDYEGVDMPTFDAMRESVHGDGTVVRVIKNTLLQRVLSGVGDDSVVEALPAGVLDGMTAVALISEENFASSGKMMLNAEKKKKIKIKAGLHEGRVLNAGEVRVLASIPSKEELYSTLVGALSSIIGKLVVVLDEVKEQKEAK